MKSSVIIATNNRCNDLKECLNSLNRQSLLPDEIVIAHGGSDKETEFLIEELDKNVHFRISVKYFNFGLLGAAVQRNLGSEKARGDILFFLDDDVICESEFVKEIVEVFKTDRRVGGVSGIITNQSYEPISSLNKFLFDLALKSNEKRKDYAGRLVGPAVNFLPLDHKGKKTEVDWMPSCCCAYRKDIFSLYTFNKHFSGYSFAEDVELSARVAKEYKLINTTKARLFHKDLGGRTHKNWFNIGKMQTQNRWYIFTNVMGRNNLRDKLRFFYYIGAYCTIIELRYLVRTPTYTLLRWCGRMVGFLWL